MKQIINLFFFIFSLFLSLSGVQSTTFTIINRCRRTVWPGLLSGATSPPLPTTGFALKPGDSVTIPAPRSWSGRLWARTFCTHYSSNNFTCLTGDCGSLKVECNGNGATPPATLAEFTLNGADGLDFYDVSLVDGYNLPMLVIPKRGKRGGCSATGCLVELNGACPRELRVSMAVARGSVACKSACEAFKDPQFCCSEAYATPDTCRPSVYSQFFKNACPRAYSYAYDDKTSTYTCAGAADYEIMFCPPPYASQKLLGERKDGAVLPLVNKSTMYLASHHANGASFSGLVQLQFTAHGGCITMAIFLFWLHFLHL